jgi:hypothetical protein
LGDLIGIKMPSVEDEQANPEKTYDIYKSCVLLLKSKTRDKEKYRMIFAENINFGFRRNLWGMKSYALVFTILSIFLVLVQIYSDWNGLSGVRPVISIALILDISFLSIWIFQINPDWVKSTSEAYVTQLLYACDQIEE